MSIFPALRMFLVPNVPCGVESQPTHAHLHFLSIGRKLFLMYRVELKGVPSAVCRTPHPIAKFLMYRVELKAYSKNC